jgi:hypothetical protein
MRKLFVLAIGLCVIGGCGSLQKKTPPTDATITITQQPASVSVVAPAPAQFSVQASSSTGAPLTYAWSSTPKGSKTAVPVGTNSPTLVIDPTSTSETGSVISVAITTDSDPVNSAPAMLTVTSGSDSSVPTVVQTQSSFCGPVTTDVCAQDPVTNITVGANDDLYIFVILAYGGVVPTGGANVLTPHVVDSGGTLVLNPGVLPLGDPVGPANNSPCEPGNIGGNNFEVGICVIVYSELSLPAGSHSITLTDAPNNFAYVNVVAVELTGASHGVDAQLDNYGTPTSRNGSGPVEVGNLITNVPNEFIFGIVCANDSGVSPGAGFTSLWTGEPDGTGDPSTVGIGPWLIEVEPAPTAGSYPIVFYFMGDSGGWEDAFSIY